MTIRIIGIDCATQAEKIGLAMGEWSANGLRVLAAQTGIHDKQDPSDTIWKWIREASGVVLLAIDAPLGWPVGMRSALTGHRAGAPIATPANEMFRRTTDVLIKGRLGKTSLDVGADRIARTAHTALGMLGELGERNASAIPLAWNPATLAKVSAIEVYPAALLCANKIETEGYKRMGKGQGLDARALLVEKVIENFSLQHTEASLLDEARANADVLDALLCLVAGADFLAGRATAPLGEHQQSCAEIEGWIWSIG